MLVLALSLALPALAASYQLDLTPLKMNLRAQAVATHGAPICAVDADSRRTLAVAAVFYARKPGRSAWGHSSLRFLSCEAGVLVDEEYEYYGFNGNILERLTEREPEWPSLRDPRYTRALRGQLYLLQNPAPADDGHYAAELKQDRDIYEIWLPLDPDARQALHADYRTRHATQQARLAAGQPLGAGPYRILRENCALPVRDAMVALEPDRRHSVFPYRLMARLEARETGPRVRHASHHELNRMVEKAGGPVTLSSFPAHREVGRRRSTARMGPTLLTEDAQAYVEGELERDPVPAVLTWLGALSSSSPAR